jgi:hypothetical protein
VRPWPRPRVPFAREFRRRTDRRQIRLDAIIYEAIDDMLPALEG